MTLMQDKYPAFLYRVGFRVMFVCPAFLRSKPRRVITTALLAGLAPAHWCYLCGQDSR